MFCGKCGHNIGMVKNFCPECGAKIIVSNSGYMPSKIDTKNSSNVTEIPIDTTVKGTIRKQNIKKGLKLLVLIVLIPFLLFSAIGARFVWVTRLINWYSQDN